MQSNIAKEMLKDLHAGNTKHLNALIIVDKEGNYRLALNFLLQEYGYGQATTEDMTNLLEAGAQCYDDKDRYLDIVQLTQHQAYGMSGVDKAALDILNKYAGPLESPTQTLSYVFSLVVKDDKQHQPDPSLARTLIDQGADPEEAIKYAMDNAQKKIRQAAQELEQLQTFQQTILKGP